VEIQEEQNIESNNNRKIILKWIKSRNKYANFNNKEINELIMSETNFLDIKISISERIHYIKNNLYKQKCCRYCDNDISILSTICNNKKCKSELSKHSMLGKKVPKKSKIKMSIAAKNRPKITEETRQKLKGRPAWNKGLTKETDERVAKYGKSGSKTKTGIKLPESTKEKMSLIARKRISDNGFFHSIGNNETKLLDEQEIKDNCKIDRRFKLLGYKPDGYCHETNIIYEVYEKHHNKKKNLKKDLIRQQKIQNFLACDFIIIYDNYNDNKIEKFKYQK
jgi:hypothetical protein